MKTTDQMQSFAGIWACAACNEIKRMEQFARWRWNGEAWEHQCGDPQAGYSTGQLVDGDMVTALRADYQRLRWILDHPQTFGRMSERFVGDALLSLIDNEIAEREEFRND